jgi:hypothetical protein
VRRRYGAALGSLAGGAAGAALAVFNGAWAEWAWAEHYQVANVTYVIGYLTPWALLGAGAGFGLAQGFTRR